MAVVTVDEFAPLLDRPGVTQKKAFGGLPALFINGNMFVQLLKHGVSYKLSETEIVGTSAEGKTRPMGGGDSKVPIKKTWILIPFEATVDNVDLAERALRNAEKLPTK